MGGKLCALFYSETIVSQPILQMSKNRVEESQIAVVA
jgi:hypothetical protein